MMKRQAFVSILLLYFFCVSSQPVYTDSLKNALSISRNPVEQIGLLKKLGNEFRQLDPTSAIQYSNKALQLLNKHPNPADEAFCYNVIGLAHIHLNQFQPGFEKFGRSMKIYDSLRYYSRIADTYNFIGIAFKEKDMYDSALIYFMKSLSMKEANNLTKTLPSSYHNIAIIYRHKKKYEKAIEYYGKSAEMKIKLNDEDGLVKTYLNMGLVYSQMSLHDTALYYYHKSLSMAQGIKDELGINNAYVSISNALVALAEENMGKGDTIIAHKQLKEALGHLEVSEKFQRQRGSNKSIGAILINTGSIYSKLNDIEKANQYFLEGISLTRAASQLEFTRNGYKGLSLAYEKRKDFETSLRYYKLFKDMDDSLFNINSENLLIEWQTKYETELKDHKIRDLNNQNLIQAYQVQNQQAQLKQEKLLSEKKGNEILLLSQNQEIQKLQLQRKESELKEQQLANETKKKALQLLQKDNEVNEIIISRQKVVRNFLIAGTVLVGLFLIALAGRFRVIQRQKKIITKEKERSESLLLNILPSEVAEELKEKGEAKAQLFDEVTVLFSDFKNFTLVSERLTPEELVAELNECFKVFDEIMERNGVEKIKTVGDAYLAAAGLPSANPSHAEDAIKAATEMQQFMVNRHRQLGEKSFEMRVGLHSGKVVAGIVGVKKFAYDIWGDTVNTAARMEQNGAPGKINISESTYELIKDMFTCTYRGEVEAKNKGKLKMYFVE